MTGPLHQRFRDPRRIYRPNKRSIQRNPPSEVGGRASTSTEYGFCSRRPSLLSPLTTSASGLRQFSSCQRPISFVSLECEKRPSSGRYSLLVSTTSDVERPRCVLGQQPTSSTVWPSASRRMRQRLRVRQKSPEFAWSSDHVLSSIAAQHQLTVTWNPLELLAQLDCLDVGTRIRTA